MYVVKNMDALYDEIGYVASCAPDNFMHKDWRPPEEQDTLESSFSQLRDAIAIIDPKIATPDKLPIIRSILEESYEAFKSGDRRAGVLLLNEWSALIFGPEP